MDYLWLEEKVLSLVKQELILGTPDHQRTALCQTAVNEVRSEGNNSSRQWRDDETQQKRVTDRKSSKRSRRCELHSLLGLLPRVYWCCLLQPEARMLLWGRQLIKMSDKLVGRNSSSRGKKRTRLNNTVCAQRQKLEERWAEETGFQSSWQSEILWAESSEGKLNKGGELMILWTPGCVDLTLCFSWGMLDALEVLMLWFKQ